MESEKDFTKEELAIFYKEKDMNGIEREYRSVLKDREIKSLRAQLAKEKERASALENNLLSLYTALKKMKSLLEID